MKEARAREIAAIKTAKDPRKRVTPADLEVLGTLGEGNFSRIALVKHRQTGEHFALKILEKAQVERVQKRHPNVANEISMERRILSRLRHPNVVELYHAFQDCYCLYMLLEYCAGGEVWQRLQAEGKSLVSVGVPYTLARFYTREVVEALRFLHGEGIVHRDVKPENMVLTARGRLKLIDFGTAKDVIETDLNGPDFVGTPEYMSPEASRSQETFMEADLWALGCCLYQFLVGVSPFRAPAPYLVFLRSRRCCLRFPAVVPPHARDLILKLLRRRPQERLGSSRNAMNDARGHAAILSHPFFSSSSTEGDMLPDITSTTVASEDRLPDLSPVVSEASPREAQLRDLAAQCITHAISTRPPGSEFVESMLGLKMPERAVVLHLLERHGRLGEPRVLRLAQLGLSSSPPFSPCSTAESAKSRILGRIDWSGKEVYGLSRADQGTFIGPFFLVYLGGLSCENNEHMGPQLQKAICGINRLRPRLVVVSSTLFEQASTMSNCEAGWHNEVWDLLGRISQSIPIVFAGAADFAAETSYEVLDRHGSMRGCAFWYGGMRGLVLPCNDTGGVSSDEKTKEDDWVVEELEQACYFNSQNLLIFAPHSWFKCNQASHTSQMEVEIINKRVRKWALGNVHGHESCLRAIIAPSVFSESCSVKAIRDRRETDLESDSSSDQKSDEDDEGSEDYGQETHGLDAGCVNSVQAPTHVEQVLVREACIVEVYRNRVRCTFLTLDQLSSKQSVHLAPEFSLEGE